MLTRPESNYFEIEILDRGESRFGESHSISIGVVNIRFPLDTHIGRAVDSESIAYHTGEGTVHHGGPKGKKFGERCEIGDKIGWCSNLVPCSKTTIKMRPSRLSTTYIDFVF